MSYKYTFTIEVEIELSVEEHAACVKQYQDNWSEEIADPDGGIPEIPNDTDLVLEWAHRSCNTIDEDHGMGITLKWSNMGDADGGEVE
jgi:hypothetical protein